MSRVPLVSVLAAFLLAAATPLLAQQGTAEIGGKVADEQGGALPGVAIVITNEDTGAFRDVTSGSDGSYFASQLTPGRYPYSGQACKLPDVRARRPPAGGRQDADDQRDAR